MAAAVARSARIALGRRLATCAVPGLGQARRHSSSAGLGWGSSAAAVSEASPCLPSHRLRVAASGIPNSGLGVFVEGSGGEDDSAAIPEGTVVALYSGVYFPLVPLHARAAARGEGVVTDVLRLSKLWGYGAVEESLQDVSYEEASSYWLILEVFSGVMDGYGADLRVGCKSPYAVGQLINHPHCGTRPNVDWQEFRWPDGAMPNPANRLHRGLWYIDPVTSEAVDMPDERGALKVPLPGIAIVATRDLEPGEELFMKYRFNPAYPPWYTPVENASAK